MRMFIAVSTQMVEGLPVDRGPRTAANASGAVLLNGSQGDPVAGAVHGKRSYLVIGVCKDEGFPRLVSR
jgi:hypothetical protein